MRFRLEIWRVFILYKNMHNQEAFERSLLGDCVDDTEAELWEYKSRVEFDEVCLVASVDGEFFLNSLPFGLDSKTQSRGKRTMTREKKVKKRVSPCK